ncbi:hypothetical protein EYF80_026634 [Liparis tanakae]|uniref:Uncharacterized protein n=1 Tax=Liparis tanakae TaxID=230148 RepID=A0A4Z2HCD1_9TELE|nr:hypothetical protein EYF80_026634 [Liparis tanakae]
MVALVQYEIFALKYINYFFVSPVLCRLLLFFGERGASHLTGDQIHGLISVSKRHEDVQEVELRHRPEPRCSAVGWAVQPNSGGLLHRGRFSHLGIKKYAATRKTIFWITVSNMLNICVKEEVVCSGLQTGPKLRAGARLFEQWLMTID